MTSDYINKILCEGHIKAMSKVEDGSIDAIITDQPYAATSIHWDIPFSLPDWWAQCDRICKPNAVVVMFGIQPVTTDLICSNRKNFKYCLVWNKNVPTGMAQASRRPMRYHEDILVFYRQQPTYNPVMKPRVGVGKACYNYDHYCGESNHLKLEKVKKRYDPDFVQPSTVLDFKVVPNRRGKLHPTQKPVDLMEYLVKTYTNAGDLVLDPFVGSGTTCVAAKNLGRRWIGLDTDAGYVKIANDRIEKSKISSTQL